MTFRHEPTLQTRRYGWLLALWAMSCLIGALAQPAVAQYSEGGAISREYPLKALFLYNFGSYVEWPADAFPSPQSPFVIGVVGTAALDDTLNQIAATKKISGRKIVFQRFANAADVKPCQILFIARSVPEQERRRIIESLRNHPVLIVGESANFANEGASVNFFQDANKMRFEINLSASKQQQLKISSKLLAMAKIVQNDAGASGRQ
jgi:hypothetical protein